MSDHDLLLQTIDAIYASAVDSERVSAALEAMNRLLGAEGATLEVIDMLTQKHTSFWSVGATTDAGNHYLNEFAAINPRMPYALKQPAGKVIYDYQVLNEDQMGYDPFYSDFLLPLGLRYCIGAVLERSPEKVVLISAQRTAKQGHADQRELELMGRLCPHLQRAYDVTSRMKIADTRQSTYENAFNWLTDGVALLRGDGRVVYANDAFSDIARRNDAFRVIEGLIEFSTSDSRDRFSNAIRDVEKTSDNLLAHTNPNEFPVPRSNDMPAYTVALRPLVRGQTNFADAVALMLVHDPLVRNRAAKQLLQQLFNLTPAEANLAQALCAGMATSTYASTRRVSLNTVYTHLRRIREKTDCNSVAELMRRFSELSVPLRLT